MTIQNAVCFDEDLVIRYDGRGPRYTSYPTALQFHDDFGLDEYRRHARISNASQKPLSVYVHIPFCHALCYYCGCNKIVTRNASRVQNYLHALHREIEMQAELFDSARSVEQLHFGGGTPTYLDEPQLRSLMRALHRSFRFDESDSRQFSIEVDPRTVGRAEIELLAELGFNRMSLGVQDFDAVVQKAVNRIQSADQIKTLLIRAQQNGFRSISFDLIYGLPHQSVKSFDQTLDKVIDMQPNRLAIYNYAHLPERFKGQRMIRDEDIPQPKEKLDILHHTIDKLTGAGYVYIGMDHFALPDDELVSAQQNHSLQRNFQGYSTHANCDLIGLGVSAIGNIGGSYVQNSLSTIEYEEQISQGNIPVKRGLSLDDDDKLRARVIQKLMCYDAMTFAEIEREFSIVFSDYFEPELAKLQPLADDGLIVVDDKAIHITSKGRLLLRSIGMVFDRYLPTSQDNTRYSRAI
ncbi:MAG: oxygen-independent coproporphyrinogen III oxidase [Gammaproteobacteria bacterium]|nr:oxygen-independent coproporphyrinogen III oxidase [Gammaproteobacteria bacterium]MDH3646055.1 oxygen-independent coproporphyrinogen III oxidase [Gammaproteobacteria bacterium]